VEKVRPGEICGCQIRAAARQPPAQKAAVMERLV
jgi:hypothetical protein